MSRIYTSPDGVGEFVHNIVHYSENARNYPAEKEKVAARVKISIPKNVFSVGQARVPALELVGETVCFEQRVWESAVT